MVVAAASRSSVERNDVERRSALLALSDGRSSATVGPKMEALFVLAFTGAATAAASRLDISRPLAARALGLGGRVVVGLLASPPSSPTVVAAVARGPARLGSLNGGPRDSGARTMARPCVGLLAGLILGFGAATRLSHCAGGNCWLLRARGAQRGVERREGGENRAGGERE